MASCGVLARTQCIAGWEAACARLRQALEPARRAQLQPAAIDEEFRLVLAALYELEAVCGSKGGRPSTELMSGAK